ncbi:MAG: ABC transporter substrate-binding protein [Gloeomargaritaceae cyanobacterium C42_A2020_066]|nr:ABC transporter substrate-binding protein [Gloeomargaritaceae cyanobacterium C42_A2020_066]
MAKGWYVRGLVCAGVGVALASCQTPTEGLKIGTLLPATGDLASVGQDMLNAPPLVVETVNACGGVNGRPVTLIQEDDQTQPTAGAAAMTKLVEVDRVAGVVGSFASSVSTAAVDIGVRGKVPLVSPGSTSPVFTARAKKGDFQGYWFRTAPSDVYQAQALAALAQKRNLKRVNTVVINNDYGVGFEQAFVQTFTQVGGTVGNRAKPTRYDPNATALETEAKAAFAGRPQGVAAVLYAETGALLLKSAYEQGLAQGTQVLLTDGVQSEEFVQSVGKTPAGTYILAGALGTVPGADGPALAQFNELWQGKFGRPPGPYAPHAWDAAALLILAAQAAGTNTGEALASKLRQVSAGPGEPVTDVCQGLALLRESKRINYQGASGTVDFDEYGDVVGSYDVWQVTPAGKIVTIDQVKPLGASSPTPPPTSSP